METNTKKAAPMTVDAILADFVKDAQLALERIKDRDYTGAQRILALGLYEVERQAIARLK